MEWRVNNIIYVIDAPCGFGKTSWAIQNINNNPDESYIYCTPFLDEVSRVRKHCGAYERFKEPVPYTGTKIDDFNTLLSRGDDITVTHTTFLNATPETLELIRTGDYTLIIDEVLDVITDFNKVQSVENAPRQNVNNSDVKMLLDNNIIQIDDNGRVLWIGSEYDDCKFSEVQRFAKLGRLYCVDNNFLLTVFPPEIFKCFKSIYILTYMFGGSMFKYYLDLFNIKYELKSVIKENNKYDIVDYNPIYDMEFRKKCKALITICDNRNMNNYKTNTLSKTWYDRCSKEDMKTLQNHVYNYFRRYLQKARACNGDIMWTCYEKYRSKLEGAGYTVERKLTAVEKKLPKDKQDKLKQKLSCFVPCNARATNDYHKR